MWRVGRKLQRTIYRDDELVGMMDDQEIAMAVVDCANRCAHAMPKPSAASTDAAKLEWLVDDIVHACVGHGNDREFLVEYVTKQLQAHCALKWENDERR